MLRRHEKETLEYFSTHEVEACPRPFAQAAADLGVSEAALIGTLRRLQKKGVIKSLRGVVSPRHAGYTQNALIAWKSSAQSTDAERQSLQDIFLADDRISHCYRRKAHPGFAYDIFTMMHARTKKEIVDFTKKAAQQLKFQCEILFTGKELKKERLALVGMLC